MRGRVANLGERINMTYGAMNADSLISSEIEGRKGHTVVSCKLPPPSHRRAQAYHLPQLLVQTL
jgi:hypothetical protein